MQQVARWLNVIRKCKSILVWAHSTPKALSCQLCTLAPITLTVGNNMSFMMSPREGKRSLALALQRWSFLKTTKTASANKQLVSTSNSTEHQNNNRSFFVLTISCRGGEKKRERERNVENHEKLKTKFWDWVQTSWNRTHNSCSLSPDPKRKKLSGSHSCCETRL